MHFTKATEIAQDRIIFKGMVGDCDGVAIIAVPKRRLPTGVSFIITHPMCAPAPVKLQEYKIHRDPPGIAGHLVEGLLYHDIFVFDKKKSAVSVQYGVAETVEALMTAGEEGTINLSVTIAKNGCTAVYKTGTSVSAPKLGADISAWAVLPADGAVTAAAGSKVCVALRNSDGKCVGASAIITA